MGLDINSVMFLIEAHKKGVRFDDVLTLGRQHLNVFPAKMTQVLQRHGLPAEPFQQNAPDTIHADPFFKCLGAKQVDGLDVSDFEGARFVHDLNQPISPELKERFGVVYDGGSLEHVFNFPVALKNCLEMVRVGGRFFTHTSANNWCGHGFYQFSPELFFRVLSEENGFKCERMVIHRVGPYGRWYEVNDPKTIHARVELVTFTPVQLMIQAQRISAVPIFAQTPQQSDYSVRWEDPNQPGGKAAPFNPARSTLAQTFPNLMRLVNVIKMCGVLLRTQTIMNRRSFRPVKKP